MGHHFNFAFLPLCFRSVCLSIAGTKVEVYFELPKYSEEKNKKNIASCTDLLFYCLIISDVNSFIFLLLEHTFLSGEKIDVSFYDKRCYVFSKKMLRLL